MAQNIISVKKRVDNKKLLLRVKLDLFEQQIMDEHLSMDPLDRWAVDVNRKSV